MSEVNTVLKFGEHSFDLGKKKAMDLETLAVRELAELFNAGIGVHMALGGKASDPVTKFRDREAGEKRVAALHSSILAQIESNAAVAKEEQKAAKKAEKGAAKAASKAGTTSDNGDAAADGVKAPRRPRGTGPAAPKYKFTADSIITVLAETPGKVSADAAADYAHYKTGMTCGEFYAAVGSKKGGVRLHFDSRAGRIEITG